MRRLLLGLVLSLGLAGCSSDLPPTVSVRNSRLRRPDLLLYPAGHAAKALIFFFGNDVGFWSPHRHLAARLARDGYDVAGLDVRSLLSHLPSGEPQRDRAFADSIVPLIAEVRHEFGDSLPFILGGHSFGAEVAFWVAKNEEPPRLRGVLALSPGAMGHLFITAGDLANREPHGVGAWSTIYAAHVIDPGVRIALVRGSKDRFGVNDSAFVAAGGSRLRRFVIPIAGHTLKRLLLAGPIIEHAVSYLMQGSTNRPAVIGTHAGVVSTDHGYGS